MRCLFPIRATRSPKSGAVALWPKGLKAEDSPLKIPCGRCINCRMQDRLQWALRCTLEASQHTANTFATLTFSDEHLPNPPSLELRHLQLFYKKLRKELTKQKRTLRHFSCGEYGEKNGRPHYHAILFGLHHEKDKVTVENAWTAPSHGDEYIPLGHVRLYPADQGGINYVVGYQNKKLGDFGDNDLEHLDTDTGELTPLKKPFRTMSKKPGIGANAKEHRHSWKTHAVLDGKTIAVPRFLHNAWKSTATPEELNEHEEQKQLRNQKSNEARTREEKEDARALAIEEDRDRQAQLEIQKARQAGHAAKRKL